MEANAGGGAESDGELVCARAGQLGGGGRARKAGLFRLFPSTRLEQFLWQCAHACGSRPCGLLVVINARLLAFLPLPALRWFVSTHAAGDTAFGISNSVCAALCCVQGARLDEEAQSTMRLLADIESTFCCHLLFFAFSFWSPACHPLVSLELLSLCCCPRAPFSDTCPLGALRVLFLETLPAPYSLPTPFFLSVQRSCWRPQRMSRPFLLRAPRGVAGRRP